MGLLQKFGGGRFASSASTINERVAKSVVGRWFRLDGSGHPLERPGSKFLTEIRAGTVTAAAMLYVSRLSAL